MNYHRFFSNRFSIFIVMLITMQESFAKSNNSKDKLGLGYGSITPFLDTVSETFRSSDISLSYSKNYTKKIDIGLIYNYFTGSFTNKGYPLWGFSEIDMTLHSLALQSKAVLGGGFGVSGAIQITHATGEVFQMETPLSSVFGDFDMIYLTSIATMGHSWKLNELSYFGIDWFSYHLPLKVVRRNISNNGTSMPVAVQDTINDPRVRLFRIWVGVYL